jgi:hypothetical protein
MPVSANRRSAGMCVFERSYGCPSRILRYSITAAQMFDDNLKARGDFRSRSRTSAVPSSKVKVELSLCLIN